MLKIRIWMRGTNEYNRDTIPGPTPDQTQEQFEEAFRESDECFCGGDVYETCPYFDFTDGRDIIEIFLSENKQTKISDEPVHTTSKWDEFELVKGGGCNYVPLPHDDINKVNIWWYHDMKFNQYYYWDDVTEFDPKKLSFQYGKDQNGYKYLEEVLYDGECPDDYDDYGDTGYGYSDIEYVYHPDQKFAEEKDED
jgi:hypothetical protein